MKLVPPAVADALTVGGFRAAWAGVRWMPEPAAYALFDRLADIAVARGHARKLRANYARVRPELDHAALDDLVRDGMRAYLRYYGEAFRLPALSSQQLADRVRLVGDVAPRRVIADGGSVVAFLGHLGNWDLAGAWAAVHWTQVTTVAERLKPEQIFQEFLRFREGLGMRILPLTGGPAPFPQLRQAARQPGIIPLLADRDLTRAGVEVEFCGQRAAMAAGPAALALAENRPLFPVSIHHEPRTDLGRSAYGIVITFHDQVHAPGAGTMEQRIAAMTQGCAHALTTAVTVRTADWHMLQRVFVDDVPGRARP